jgi:peptide/nickel transport system substrate-binding protein
MFSRQSLALALTALLLAVAGVSGAAGSARAAGKKSQPGSATFAELPGLTPNYIFPMDSLPYFSFNNITLFQYLMYRPLYFFGTGTQPGLNNTVSLAAPPVYTHHNTVATITLKHYLWSDGKPVTTADIQFWENLVTANKTDWAGYAPGFYPDNIKSTKILSATKIAFTLTHPVSPTWFTDNELSQITPLPIQTMDRISSTSPVKRYDESKAGAAKVYQFLNAQSKTLSTYATNPVWTTVDGPWKLQSFTIDGKASFVPNPRYSGPIKPSLAHFTELPFTSDAAELEEVLNHQLTVGYLPFEDVPELSQVKSAGYSVVPWQVYMFNYFAANEQNPQIGAIVRQPYVRQALEELINQPGIIKAVYHGYADKTCGPVPLTPGDPYVSSTEKSCPLAYNPSAAKKLLSAHGWHVVPGGVTTCAKPGSGSGRCGAGIPSGAKLAFNLVFATGNVPLDESVQVYKSNAELAGVKYTLSSQSFSAVSGLAVPCKSGQSTCSWQLADWGAGWLYSPDFYPTGEEIFASGAGGNTSNYSDTTNDKNIQATVSPGASQATLNTYQNYLAKQVPFIWQPAAPYQLTAISSKIQGVTPQNIYFNLLPEQWRLAKG